MRFRRHAVLIAAALSIVLQALAVLEPGGASAAGATIDSFAVGGGAVTDAACVPSPHDRHEDFPPTAEGGGAFNVAVPLSPEAASVSCSAGGATASASASLSSVGSVNGGGLTLTQSSQGTVTAQQSFSGDPNQDCIGSAGNAGNFTTVFFTIASASSFSFSGALSAPQAETHSGYRLSRQSPGPAAVVFDTSQGSSPNIAGALDPGTYRYDAEADASLPMGLCTDSGTRTDQFEYHYTLSVGAASSCPPDAVPSLQVGLALAEGCFTERKDEEEHGTGVFETSEEAWVGGFDLKPNPGGVLVLEPSNHSAPLRAEGGGVNLLLRHLSVPAPLGEIKPFVNSYSLGINTVGSLEHFLGLPLLSGQVTVKWDSAGAGATLEGGISIEELSKNLGSLEKAGVGTTSGKLTLRLQNNAPADVTAGELQLPEYTVEVKGTKPTLKMGFGGAVFKAQEVGGVVEWSGQASAFFPFQERQGSLTGRLFLRDSSLSGFGLALSGIQVPIGATGWFLSGVNGNLVLSPELGFDLGIEAFEPLKLGKKGGGPTLFKLTGNIKGLKLATDCTNGSNPFEFVGTTNAPELEAREIGTLKAQVVMCAYVPSAKDFAFEAGVNGELSVDIGSAKGVASAKGSAKGWFHGFDFNLDGNYQLQLPVIGTIAAQGLLSSEGYAICGQYHFISVGVATHNWLEAPEDITGCDFTPFRAAKPSNASVSAAHGPSTVRLRRGERVVGLALRGAKGAPRVRLLGPHGERFSSRAGVKPLAAKAVIVVPEPGLDTTYVYLKHPSAGLWRVQSLGGAPVRRIDTAHQLPEPKVSATISAKGFEEVLHWKARRIPGQQIALIDRTDGVATTLQDFTSRHSGKLRFTPENATDAPRTIEADVLQNGIPRARLTVAHYSASGSNRRAARIRIGSASCRGRTCKAKLRLPSGTRRVRLQLRHGKRTIATSSRRAKAGTRTVTLRLHRGLTAGTYTLRVTATLSAGQSTTASKALHVRGARAGHRRRSGRASAAPLVAPPFLSD